MDMDKRNVNIRQKSVVIILYQGSAAFCQSLQPSCCCGPLSRVASCQSHSSKGKLKAMEQQAVQQRGAPWSGEAVLHNSADLCLRLLQCLFPRRKILATLLFSFVSLTYRKTKTQRTIIHFSSFSL